MPGAENISRRRRPCPPPLSYRNCPPPLWQQVEPFAQREDGRHLERLDGSLRWGDCRFWQARSPDRHPCHERNGPGKATPRSGGGSGAFFWGGGRGGGRLWSVFNLAASRCRLPCRCKLPEMPHFTSGWQNTKSSSRSHQFDCQGSVNLG